MDLSFIIDHRQSAIKAIRETGIDFNINDIGNTKIFLPKDFPKDLLKDLPKDLLKGDYEFIARCRNVATAWYITLSAFRRNKYHIYFLTRPNHGSRYKGISFEVFRKN